MILEAKERLGSKDEEASGPSLRYHTAEVDALLRAVDGINGVAAAVIAAAGAKPPRYEPQPRPMTAFERAQHRRKGVKHQSLVSRLLPGSDG